METRTKIIFKLEQDDSGYPPVGWEGIWAHLLENNLFEIDNIPFFVRGISVGDKVKVTKVDDEFHYVDLNETSGNSTYRIFVTEQADVMSFLASLKELGVEYEGSHIPKLVAINVSFHIPIQPIKDFLGNK